MNCDCIEKADAQLKELNTEISVTFTLPAGNEYISVPTQWIAGSKPKRGTRPKVVLASFCPFCGVSTAKVSLGKSLSS